jgi:phage-related protein
VKLALFHPKARAILKEFPEDVRREWGKAIYELQKGAKPSLPLSRPMPTVAVGVEELRVKDRSGAYRTFYFARQAEAVLIFHAFKRKPQTRHRMRLH